MDVALYSRGWRLLEFRGGAHGACPSQRVQGVLNGLDRARRRSDSRRPDAGAT
jgi:hypothetical protein